MPILKLSCSMKARFFVFGRFPPTHVREPSRIPHYRHGFSSIWTCPGLMDTKTSPRVGQGVSNGYQYAEAFARA